VAASEIQNLKNSLDFSKMQKIAAKFSRLFLVRSAGFFQKQRFLSKMPSFFDEILEKLGSKPRFSARHLW
jgi:pilus assembly protein TadC